MATYTGDKTAGTGKVSTVSRKKGWADLNLSLVPHPIRKDIVPLRDDAAIKNAVKNLVLTNFYERPFQPEKAANLRGLLFEPADGITKYELSDGIRSVLEDYEPRIKVQHIQVIDEEVNNSYRISIYFEIIQLDIMSEVEIVLQRLR
jgi:phage baseplate assembly protein W